MKKRALMIDAQLLQSLAYHRGMGKYSLSLLKELDKKTDFYEKKILILNRDGIDNKEMESLKTIVPDFQIELLDLKRAGVGNHKRYSQYEKDNKASLDKYISNNLSNYQVDFMILSLFQDAEISTFPTNCASKYLLIYDLIPLQLPDYYLFDPYTREVYLSRYKVLNEANHFFTISRTVATDLSIHLGIPSDRITPIYGAPIKRQQIISKSIDCLVDQPFILLPSGDDHRKNNRRAVLAFNEFNQKQNKKYKLVMTSFFNERTQSELNAYCPDLYFSGNVSEEELSWLYEQAEIVFFPTEYEGLGLPILEAIEFNKPIVCSDIEVFKEIDQEAFNFADPYDIENMKDVLYGVISNNRKPDNSLYKKILSKYDWATTAKTAAQTLKTHSYLQENIIKKPRIAIFAPSPEGYSAIGKVVQEQHYLLTRLAQVDYYLDTGTSERARQVSIRPNYLQYATNCYDPWSFTKNSNKLYDQVIYHIGNSEYHVASLVKALTYPDTVIMHDISIEGLFGVAKSAGFIDEARYDAELSLQQLISGQQAQFCNSLVNRQKRAIVHSKYALNALKKNKLKGSSVHIKQLSLPTPIPYFFETKNDQEKLIISIAGIIHEAKGLELVKEISELHISNKTVVLKIFGFSLLTQESYDALSSIPNIQLIQSPSDSRFLHELSQSDIVVNFRSQYHGETSLSTIESLRFGKTVIVNKSGWFDEIPEGIVSKIDSKDEVVPEIINIAQDNKINSPDSIKKRVRYVESNHNIGIYLQGMLGLQKDE